MRWSAALIALPLLAGGLGGCGGDRTEPDTITPVAAVQRAVDHASAESATYVIDLTGAGITVHGSGSFREGSDPAANLVFDRVEAFGLTLNAIEYRMVADTAYVRLGGGWQKLPAAKGSGVRIGPMDVDTLTDPIGRLRKLLDTQDVTEVGPETVDGVATTHYQARTQVATSSASPTTSATQPTVADVWVDRDHRARRFAVDLPLLGGMKLTVNISDYGTPVEVQPPPDAREWDGTGLKFGPLG